MSGDCDDGNRHRRSTAPQAEGGFVVATHDQAAIKLSGLTKTYRRGKGLFTAVNNVTLAVPPGQVLGLLGPNGAGKTTTIKMACGLILPSAGSIRLNGYDVGRQRS